MNALALMSLTAAARSSMPPKSGEAVVAYVVAPDADPVDLAARVTEHCGRHLARFKVPTRVEVVEALPHTVTGKVQKGRLRRWERRRADGAL